MGKRMTSIRLPDDVRAELDAWRESQRVVPDRSATIVQAIREFLAREKGQKRKN